MELHIHDQLNKLKESDKQFLVRLANTNVSLEEIAAIAKNMIEQNKNTRDNK